MRVHLRPQAEADLRGIHDYIAQFDRRRAESFVLELRRKVEALSHMPDAYPYVGRGDVRRRIHERYLILFRLNKHLEEVSILRILHSARDLSLLELL